MSLEVVSNADLARKLVGMGGSEILASSKTIRDAEPCAKSYERFRQSGCRAETEEEKQCLDGIGLDSALCTGTYAMSQLKNGFVEHRKHIPVLHVANVVTELLLQPRRPNVTTVVQIKWRGGSLVVQSATSKTLTIRRGFREKVRCNMTSSQVHETMHNILTKVGPVDLSCLAHSVTVPKFFTIRLTRYDELRDQEWPLLTGERGN